MKRKVSKDIYDTKIFTISTEPTVGEDLTEAKDDNEESGALPSKEDLLINSTKERLLYFAFFSKIQSK